MAETPKTYYMNPFYDNVCAVLDEDSIPSKRVRYRIDHVAREVHLWQRQSAQQFDAFVRQSFHADRTPGWPLSGPLFMSVSITVPDREFESRDVDNLAKTIIDAFKGVAYEDDASIVALFVNKHRGAKYSFFLGLRRLRSGDGPGWYVPELYRDTPYPGQEA